MKSKLLISVFAASIFALTATSASALEVPRVGDSDVLFVFPPDVGVVESVDLSGGVQLKRTASNAVVLGPVGTQLVLVQTGSGPGLGVQVPDPDVAPTPGWSEDLASDVLDRVHAGASFASLAAQFPPFAPLAPDSADTWQNQTCLTGADKYQYVKSCTRGHVIETNSVNKFIAWTSSTRGQIESAASGEATLKHIEAIAHLGIDESVEAFEPYVTRHSTSCSDTMSLSLEWRGIGVSHTRTVCPETIDPYLTDGGARNGLTTTWKGSEKGSAASAQTEVTRAPADTGAHRVFTGRSIASINRCGGGLLAGICNLFG